MRRESKRDNEPVFHFPLGPQLHRLMTLPSTAPYFKSGTGLGKTSVDNVVRGLKDSPLWQERVIDTEFHLKDGNVVLMASGDGATCWKGKKNGRYSMFFLGSEVLNLPFKLMSRHRILHAVWPGPTHDRERVQLLLRHVYVPEMV